MSKVKWWFGFDIDREVGACDKIGRRWPIGIAKKREAWNRMVSNRNEHRWHGNNPLTKREKMEQTVQENNDFFC